MAAVLGLAVPRPRLDAVRFPIGGLDAYPGLHMDEDPSLVAEPDVSLGLRMVQAFFPADRPDEACPYPYRLVGLARALVPDQAWTGQGDWLGWFFQRGGHLVTGPGVRLVCRYEQQRASGRSCPRRLSVRAVGQGGLPVSVWLAGLMVVPWRPAGAVWAGQAPLAVLSPVPGPAVSPAERQPCRQAWPEFYL